MGPSVPTAPLMIPFTAEKWENISFIFDIPDGAPRQPGQPGPLYSNVRVIVAVTASPLSCLPLWCLLRSQAHPRVYSALSCSVIEMIQILFFQELKNVRNIKDKKNVVIEILKIVICYQAAAINHPGQRPIHQFKTRRVQNQTADLETCKVNVFSS